MAESDRIEDLRKRYHENPRRFFAPLANEYRKGGFLDRCILLCEKHLKDQPENMNGLVVYGQALFESGNQEAAKTPLIAALALDQENLIALRLLGDISRLGGDLADAKRWYEKVLEMDRRNDEVLDLLQQMAGDAGESGAPYATAGGPMISVASSVSVSGGQDQATIGMVELDAPPAPKKPAAPSGPGRTVVIDAASLAAADRSAPPAATPPARRASLLDVDFNFGELPTEEVAPPAPAQPVLSAEAAEYGFAEPEAVIPVEALEPAEVLEPAQALEPHESTVFDTLLIDTGPVAEPLTAGGHIAGLESTDFSGGEVSPLAGLEPMDFGTPQADPLPDLVSSEPENALASPLGEIELAAPDAVSPPEEESTALPLLEPEPVARPRPRMTRAGLSSLPLIADYGLEDDEPVAAPAAPPSAAPPSAAPPSAGSAGKARKSKSQKTPAFVTETMAALYLKQGYRAEAIEVYRQLVKQDPTDSGIQERLAALERGEEPLAGTGLEFDAPAADAVEPEPAEANSVLAEVSFAGVGLSTPAPTAVPLVVPTVSGPSAREFFAAFARRGASASVPPEPAPAALLSEMPVAAASETLETETEAETEAEIAPSGWPLDTLFGAATDAADLEAAAVIATVGTFEGPSGGTGLDELFAQSAAAPSTPAPRASVSRASEVLKFDQFFAPEGAPQAEAAPAAPVEPEGPAAAGDDDLNQFQGWLRGLKP